MMKLEFRKPRNHKNRVTGSIYLIVCQMNSGDWRIADFWEMPYASTNYSKAVRLRNEMAWAANQKIKWWTDKQFGIIKLELG